MITSRTGRSITTAARARVASQQMLLLGTDHRRALCSITRLIGQYSGSGYAVKQAAGPHTRSGRAPRPCGAQPGSSGQRPRRRNTGPQRHLLWWRRAASTHLSSFTQATQRARTKCQHPASVYLRRASTDKTERVHSERKQCLHFQNVDRTHKVHTHKQLSVDPHTVPKSHQRGVSRRQSPRSSGDAFRELTVT